MSGDNKLWEGHRIILPEMRERAGATCGDCRFFLKIQGQYEVRSGCVAHIEKFRKLQKRVPGVILLTEILKMAGREGLKKILEHDNPEEGACGDFLPKPDFDSYF